MIIAAWHAKDWAVVIGPTAVLLAGLVALLVNGERAERGRRRELHARGLSVVLAYAEMPFEIRRRRIEPEHRSAERVRLNTRFSEIQAELAVCQALISAEGNANLQRAFDQLVSQTRQIAGGAARNAWLSGPIQNDANLNMPALAAELQQLASYRDEYVRQIRIDARTPWRKFCDASAQ